jgi:hypothetical protein
MQCLVNVFSEPTVAFGVVDCKVSDDLEQCQDQASTSGDVDEATMYETVGDKGVEPRRARQRLLSVFTVCDV